MTSPELVIAQTRKWITDVVVGCNFCPFAAKELRQNTIRYQVEDATGLLPSLQAFIKECHYLDQDEATETSMLIFPNGFGLFDNYLELVELAEDLLVKEGYEGVYQVASFHPQYIFAGAPLDDAANYSNRSIYPMLHILREEAVEKALKNYPDPGLIPERNILFAREKGVAWMALLRESCI